MKRIILPALISIMAAVMVVSASYAQESANWNYEQFIQAVEQRQVEAVEISADRSEATVITQTGEEFSVTLPNDPSLVDLLTQYNVDVSVLPQRHDNLSFRILAPMILPGLILLGGAVFWIWVLVDCATKEANEGNTKLAWVLIIVLANWVGALLYFLVRRPQRRRELRR